MNGDNSTEQMRRKGIGDDAGSRGGREWESDGALGGGGETIDRKCLEKRRNIL